MAELGFDVSKWQGGAWNGGGGFTFAIAKLTEGVGYKDGAADRHMAAILNQPVVPGGYHFARPDLNPGTNGAYAEADWFWRVATSYGGARGMLLADDAESAGGSARWCTDFRDRLSWRLGGYNPWFYSYWSWMQSRGIVGAALLQTDPLWLAWPDANGALPNVPVAMQQYGLTSVPGIAGGVDANRFFGSVAQLKMLAVGGPAATPQTVPVASLPQPTGGSGMSMAQVTGIDGRIHRLVVVDNGEADAAGNRGGPVHWGALTGGPGGLEGWGGGDGELAGGGGWIAAGTLSASVWIWKAVDGNPAGKDRELLVIQGRGKAGDLCLKAMYTDDYSPETEWQPINGPIPAIPGNAAGTGGGQPTPPVDVAQLSEAVAERLIQRLTNG